MSAVHASDLVFAVACMALCLSLLVVFLEIVARLSRRQQAQVAQLLGQLNEVERALVAEQLCRAAARQRVGHLLRVLERRCVEDEQQPAAAFVERNQQQQTQMICRYVRRLHSDLQDTPTPLPAEQPEEAPTW